MAISVEWKGSVSQNPDQERTNHNNNIRSTSRINCHDSNCGFIARLL